MQRFRVTSFIAGQATRFARDENGATAIEYAMIAAGIATGRRRRRRSRCGPEDGHGTAQAFFIAG